MPSLSFCPKMASTICRQNLAASQVSVFIHTNAFKETVPSLHGDVDALVTKLGSLPPEAIDYMTTLLRKQGLEVK